MTARFEDRIRKAVAFVSVEGRDTFLAFGTAFIVVSYLDEYPDKAFQTLVTARHVIDRIQGDAVHLRVNDKVGKVRVLPLEKSAWRPHPNPQIDVAVCPSKLQPADFDLMMISLTEDDILRPEVIARERIGVGDQVAIAGLYVARMGENKNIPIVRVGTIAAMPEEKIRTEYGYHDAYLVEVRSIDGLSGSIVFAINPPFRTTEGQMHWSHGKTQYALGMMLGTNHVKDAGDRVEIVQPSSHSDAEGEPISVTTSLNTGIAIVLPIADVIDAINQPAIRDPRLKILATT